MIPGLSKWQTDQARRHAAEEGPGRPVVSAPIKRTRLDPVKTNHFVNFIASVNFIQGVAYGTKELKIANRITGKKCLALARENKTKQKSGIIQPN